MDVITVIDNTFWPNPPRIHRFKNATFADLRAAINWALNLPIDSFDFTDGKLGIYIETFKPPSRVWLSKRAEISDNELFKARQQTRISMLALYDDTRMTDYGVYYYRTFPKEIWSAICVFL